MTSGLLLSLAFAAFAHAAPDAGALAESALLSQAPEASRLEVGEMKVQLSSDCRVERAIYAAFTLGGLHSDVDGRVLDPAGHPVPGLFAAGRTTSGLAAQGYSSGLSLADATYFGRRAGAAASGLGSGSYSRPTLAPVSTAAS